MSNSVIIMSVSNQRPSSTIEFKNKISEKQTINFDNNEFARPAG